MPHVRSKRYRTREAIIDGAKSLMSRGEQVTVAAAAAEHGISRATAYRYFSDPQLLVCEAGLDVEVLPFEEIVAGARGPREKAIAISLWGIDLSLRNEAVMRQYLARVLDAWLRDGPADRRGARRVDFFERALDEAPLTSESRGKLIHGLTASTGIEAMIGLLDIARVDNDTARAMVREMAEALLDRFGVTE